MPQYLILDQEFKVEIPDDLDMMEPNTEFEIELTDGDIEITSLDIDLDEDEMDSLAIVTTNLDLLLLLDFEPEYESNVDVFSLNDLNQFAPGFPRPGYFNEAMIDLEENVLDSDVIDNVADEYLIIITDKYEDEVEFLEELALGATEVDDIKL